MERIPIVKIFTFLLTVLFFSGCEKEKEKEGLLQEVVFGIEHIDPHALKTDSDFDIPCQYDEEGNLLVPGIAQIILRDADGVSQTYNLELINIAGKLYTKSLRLKPGTYTVTMLLLLTEPGGTIVMATPKENSLYAPYISPGKRIEFSFMVGEFEKTEVSAEVLCYEPSSYEAFGFFWFNIHQIVVKELCFFGDICANHIPDYQEETAYGGNTMGSGNPWWYYFNKSIAGPQHIYAGQQQTDGTVEIVGNQLIINLGSWSLQDVSQPVKIKGFAEAPVNWEPPGLFDIKTNSLTIDLTGYVYDFYIIHLDIRKGNTGTVQAPFSPESFAGSLYEHVPGGLQIDMPAIFKLHVIKEGAGEVPYSPFSNVLLDESGYPRTIEDQPLDADGYLAGTSMPLCVRYPVSLQETNRRFIFKLYVWVPGTDGEFLFRHFYTFSAIDMGPLLNQENLTQPITDGVLDFVIGTCNYFPPDLLLPWSINTD